MKNRIAIALAAITLAAAPSVFADTVDANINQQQDVRTNVNQGVPNTPIWRNREFWQNEKERSGLPHFWDGTKRFFSGLNPAPWMRDQKQRYETRRTTTTTDASTRTQSRSTEQIPASQI